MLTAVRRVTAWSLLLLNFPASALSARSPLPPFAFMEPLADETADGEAPLFRLVTDPGRLAELESWVDNDAARLAAELHASAMELVDEEGTGAPTPPALHIALVPGGNHVETGFRLVSGSDTLSYPKAAYVVLGPRDWMFDVTLLHETGHVILRLFRGGTAMPVRRIAAFSHTTPALTDRTTAFDEGFATSLETLIVHVSDGRDLRNKYRHGQMLVGEWPGFLAEYYRQSSDLMTFSQTVSRYYAIRENAFAFAAATTEPDYVRVQLDPARDYAELRDANQLLQSEGFQAAVFFALVVRGTDTPALVETKSRIDRVLHALARSVGDESLTADSPHLLNFLEAYGSLYPDEREAATDALLDLSHGVFVDRDARSVWRRHYLGALNLDAAAVDREGVEARRAAWRRTALADAGVLISLLGPQVPCTVPGVTVTLPALDLSNPLSFDANTVQEGVLLTIPSITAAEVSRWLAARRDRPFADASDVANRAGLSSRTLEGLTCPQGP